MYSDNENDELISGGTDVNEPSSTEEIIVENSDDESLSNSESEADDLISVFSNSIEAMFLQLISNNTNRENLNKIGSTLEKIINIIEIIVESKVKNEECVGELSSVFHSLQESVKPFTTEHRRKVILSRNPFYIEPFPVSFGTTTKTVRFRNRLITLEKPLLAYLVPVRKL